MAALRRELVEQEALSEARRREGEAARAEAVALAEALAEARHFPPVFSHALLSKRALRNRTDKDA